MLQYSTLTRVGWQIPLMTVHLETFRILAVKVKTGNLTIAFHAIFLFSKSRCRWTKFIYSIFVTFISCFLPILITTAQIYWTWAHLFPHVAKLFYLCSIDISLTSACRLDIDSTGTQVVFLSGCVLFQCIRTVTGLKWMNHDNLALSEIWLFYLINHTPTVIPVFCVEFSNRISQTTFLYKTWTDNWYSSSRMQSN